MRVVPDGTTSIAIEQRQNRGFDGYLRGPLLRPVELRFMAPTVQNQVLVGEGRALAEKAQAAGVDVRIDVFPEMLHTFQVMAGRAPEADDAISRLADWVGPRLGLKPSTAAG